MAGFGRNGKGRLLIVSRILTQRPDRQRFFDIFWNRRSSPEKS